MIPVNKLLSFHGGSEANGLAFLATDNQGTGQDVFLKCCEYMYRVVMRVDQGCSGSKYKNIIDLTAFAVTETRTVGVIGLILTAITSVPSPDVIAARIWVKCYYNVL